MFFFQNIFDAKTLFLGQKYAFANEYSKYVINIKLFYIAFLLL